MFFEDNIDDAKYCGHLYGLGTSFVMNGNNYHDNGETNSSWCAGRDTSEQHGATFFKAIVEFDS